MVTPHESPRDDASFPRSYRVRTKSDFDKLYALRLSVADHLLIVYAGPNGLNHARLGLAVSRRAGNAVVRNRWKRLIRDAFRHSKASLPDGYDLVVSPKGGATPDGEAIRKSLVTLAHRAVRKGAKRSNPAPKGD